MPATAILDRHRDRIRLAAWLLATYAVVGAVLRPVLYGAFHAGAFSAWALVRAMSFGLVQDVLVGTLLVAPLVVAAALLPSRLLSWAPARALLLGASTGAIAFGAVVEYFFFEEFNARFNHVALDYVLHPKEVVVNIWDSYDVPLYLGVAVFLAIVCGVIAARATRGEFPRLAARSRLAASSAVVAAAAAAAGLLDVLPADVSRDRIVAEVGRNGLASLVHAFRTADLDFDAYYRTLPRPEARVRAARVLGFAPPTDAAAPEGVFRLVRPSTDAPPSSPRPWDVIVVVEESFGSEFVGVLGHPERKTSPGFDRWSRDGLLLTNLVATGNRTVRGLEGTLCSFVPLPGDSILKRPHTEHVATLGRVLKHAGYRTAFFYGGWGSFDAMKPFFPENGFDEFVERGDFAKDAFSTIWGVADEYVFDSVLEHQRRAAKAGQRFFGAVLTVSNHKPYDVPDRPTAWPASGRNREAAVAYADWALAHYLDEAKAEGLLDHTLVLIVGDHGARVYGAQQIPAASYRIPALYVVPGAGWKGRRIERVASQIDLAPTLLALLGRPEPAPLLGEDLLGLPPEGGRAFLHHNRDFGILTDDALVTLGLQKQVACYRRSGRDSDTFTLVRNCEADPELRALEDDATAVFETADELYRFDEYRLAEDDAASLAQSVGAEGGGPAGTH